MKPNDSGPAIPVFKLYGDGGDWPTPDLLHCVAAELIISAIEKNFKSGIFTADLAFGKRAYSTSGFSNQIISII